MQCAHARKRNREAHLSLNEPIANDNGYIIERGDAISEEDYLMRMGRISCPLEDLADLRLDMDRAIARLDPIDQEICRQRLQGLSLREVARSLERRESTIRSRMEAIKRHFKAVGMGDYSTGNGAKSR